MVKSLIGSIRLEINRVEFVQNCVTQNRRKVKDFYSGQLLKGFCKVHIKQTCLEILGNYGEVHIKQTCLEAKLEICSQALTRPTQGLAGTGTLG